MQDILHLYKMSSSCRLPSVLHGSVEPSELAGSLLAFERGQDGRESLGIGKKGMCFYPISALSITCGDWNVLRDILGTGGQSKPGH